MKKNKKAKAKKIKKVQVLHEYLEEVNYHAEQVSITLRHLANAIDNVRSYHLGKEVPATEETYKAAVKAAAKGRSK